MRNKHGKDALCFVSEVCQLEYGKALKRDDRNEEGKYPVYGSNGIIGYHDSFLKQGPAVVVGRKGAAGEVHFAPENFWPIDTTYYARPKRDDVDVKFLYYQLKSLKLQSLDKSTAIPGLNRNDVYGKSFYLPSISAQQAVVSKIEELFSELDKSIEQLKTAQQQLKVYRQSVLKWAFEGKLTNENVKDEELPEGWKIKQLKEIVSILGDGLHGTPIYSENGEYYFINGNNLSEGKIVFKASTKRVGSEEYQKYRKHLDETTILVSINGTLGNTAFYNGEKVILGKSACYFNLKSEANKQYVRYILTTQKFLNYAADTATGSTIPNVSLRAMKEFEIPLPTVKEQQKVVEEIERRLSVAEKLEETITNSLQQAEALRQSVLKKAFEGKLI